MKTSNTNSKKNVRATNSTSGKKVNKTNRTKKVEVPFNYRPLKISGRNFPTASQAAAYLMTHNKKAKRSQSEIARLCGVSQPCVCQLAATVK